MEGEVSETQKISAYQILALAYIAEEQPHKARESITDLLRLDYEYDAKKYDHPAQYSAEFKRYVEQMRKVVPNPESRKRERIFIGGSTLVASILVMFFL